MAENKFPNITVAGGSLQEKLMKYAANELKRTEFPVNDKVYAVLITASIGQKDEATLGGVDFVFTPKELIRLFINRGVDMYKLQPKNYDVADSVCAVTLLPRKSGLNVKTCRISGEKMKIAAVQGLRKVGCVLSSVSAGETVADIIQIAALPAEQPDISTMPVLKKY